ncbi:MAG: class IV adenylate cyclase [Methanomassiliicoccales archaeon]|nr:MAG: class IV adenylate cyclase [Methanomassiliicoccales archaeon]
MHLTISSDVMEIEVKVPIRDREGVLSRILSLGGKKTSEKVQEDLYFKHPCRDLGRTDEALRLRRDGADEVLTYKGPKLDGRSKTREEIEFHVPFEESRRLLEKLGFEGSFRVKKWREEFDLPNVKICLDDVEGLGCFLELEYKGQDVEEGLRMIGNLKKELGVEGSETRSYLEMLYFNEK